MKTRQSFLLTGTLVLMLLLGITGTAVTVARADGSDFTINNAAAGPYTYTHSTGGGAWNDGTIGKSKDIVEELEGGDFSCGDWVTFLSEITVADDAAGSQTIRITYDLTDHSTGQQGVALIDVDHVMINYGPVENGGGGGAGTFGTDTGMNDDGDSTATLVSETKNGFDFDKPTLLTGTIQVDDLEAGEVVILRFDALIGCNGDTPTGNMQEEINNAITVDSDGSQLDTINAGNQTIPFKNVGQIVSTKDLTVTKTATPSFTRTFDWTIDKSADKATVYSAGGGKSEPVNFTVEVTKDAGTDSDFIVSGTIMVYNPNTFAVNGVSLSDATLDGACTVSPASVDLAAGGGATADYVCTFASNPGSGTNTATAIWGDIGSPNTSGEGTADYTFGGPTTLVNDEINVTDTNGKSWHFTGSGSETYQMTYTDPAGSCTLHENTATITLLDKSASAAVTDCQGADLTVSKTATSSYDRTYTWGITKDVDKTLVEQFGGSATFNYTVKVSHDAGTDSNFQVNGTITVSNPNDWQDVTLTSLDDAIDNGGTCTVDISAGLTIPMGGSVDYPYECTYASAPAPADFTNTATATWDAAVHHTPNASDDGTAAGAFGDPTNVIDESVAVSDSFNGSLGAASVGGANPTSFTYSRTVPVPAYNCLTYDNTATFTTYDTGATGSASQTVKVCGPAKTGALTIGYWKTKNGQAIIKGGSSTGGVCNSATWLRQYAPFQDLSASASCTTVASYVNTVLTNALSSGASMNAMLKGQMLATALDVYFSDPALGGDFNGAPGPIGSVSVDLTKICTDLTCTTFEDSSSAFGGTPKTVLEMLSYAASQSNVGGSVWYGQVKFTQELAKDAFDALNNEKVFAP